jgi:DNA-binding NarL/FixJ family response regulator
MLIVRGIFREGRVELLEDVPFTEERVVLVAFTEGEESQANLEFERMQPGAEPLTPRQIEVLGLAQVGLSQQEIADELQVSYYTVRNHLANIYRRLGAQNRTEAVTRAVALGLLQPGGGGFQRTT